MISISCSCKFRTILFLHCCKLVLSNLSVLSILSVLRILSVLSINVLLCPGSCLSPLACTQEKYEDKTVSYPYPYLHIAMTVCTMKINKAMAQNPQCIMAGSR